MKYPIINTGQLAALLSIKKKIDEDPEWLDSKDCPYDEMVISDLKKLTEPRKIVETIEVEKIVERIVEKEVPQKASLTGKRGPKVRDISSDIESEIKEIIQDLKDLKVESEVDMKPSDKVQVVKTRVALVEKMVTLRSQTANIRKMSEFMSTVLSILDDFMSEDDRQEFMKRIAVFAKEE